MSAATAIRTHTAAAGLQPAPISEAANVPDVPKVAADSTASERPAPPRRGRAGREGAMVTSELRDGAGRL